MNGVVPDAESTTDPAYTTGAAIEIVKKLDVSLGFRLREIATEVLEARRKRRAK